ncbi:hypothetical protein [Natronogracilivirga saccharolytica]|uniref:Uncharacterized protein n=1 Tax=Natronogracilivirga saccharolytica TaxID=2812953 RepID=A0A8J7UW48_9BACT|nr:hypothetical protein [Natronogracilivirga saccharolytica]MBP3191844.1 hypothetical protein [Natronogracilivirga saccharolytica]
MAPYYVKFIVTIIITMIVTNCTISFFDIGNLFANRHIGYTLHLLLFLIVYTGVYYTFGPFTRNKGNARKNGG